MKKWMLLTLLASSGLIAHAACPTWPTAERFTHNGAAVTDQRTGLVWARCTVGQSWNGSTCTGTASGLTHEAAMQYAANQSGWRLPNVKELASLADKGCSTPAIDTTAFPATVSGWYWSSSPDTGSADYAWGAVFDDGYVGSTRRSGTRHLRLVRASQ